VGEGKASEDHILLRDVANPAAREALKDFDVDGDGVINTSELASARLDLLFFCTTVIVLG
ncbi:MAG: EF-hand domain-containing protein, partial [Flavobacteriales bacterium]